MLYVKDLPNHAFTEEFAELIMDGAVKEENDCIIWTKTLDNKGRGIRQVKFEGVSYQLTNIHRIIYQCYNGKIKSEKEVCMHICHHPDCVNHNHILIGTHFQNMQMEKVRYPNENGKRRVKGGRLSTKQHEGIRLRLIKGKFA